MHRLVHLMVAAGALVTDTAAETSLARYAFAPNELSAGKAFDFELAARVIDDNSTNTVQLRVRLGDDPDDVTENTSCAVTAAVDASPGDICLIRGRIHVQTTSRAVVTVYASDPDAPGIAVKGSVAIVEIAPNAPFYLDITAKWSVAHEDNQIQAEAFSVEELA